MISLVLAVMVMVGCALGEGPGAVYTRWGRVSCPDNTEKLYQGHAAGSFYSHSGGGANYLCMAENPEYAEVQSGSQGRGDYTYGAMYSVCDNNVFNYEGGLDKRDVYCAVCQATARPAHVMIPAKKSCPVGWTKEYQGYIMGSRHSDRRTEWVCVDSDPYAFALGPASVNGALFNLAEGKCDPLSCPPYQDGGEIACVVCTK